jgi:hypothetical protein
MMITAALLLAITLLAPSSETAQLLIIDDAHDAGCRPAPKWWDSTVASDTATPTDASEDLQRYITGLSVQFTSVLEAAWHGHVRFCTDAGEAQVLQALALLVVRPPSPAFFVDFRLPSDARLPGGARELLEGLSSAALIAQLEAVRPMNPAETARKATALQVAREASAR